MSEKKRKRHSEAQNDRPMKKLATESPPENIKVSVIEDGEQWGPVLASTPGLSIPPKITLKPYTKRRISDLQSLNADSELLLHSSIHPTLDYTAHEETSNGSENHLKHYIGIYDPENSKLEIVQARRLVVRSTLRSATVARAEEAPSNFYSDRNKLGLEFGTKKSQKAIRNLTANAIQGSPAKATTRDFSDRKPTLDPLASAVVSSMPPASSMATREELQAEIDANKPRPKANLSAEKPADAYPIEELAGVHTLKIIGVKDWMDRVKANEDIQTKSMFVARRLKREVEGGDVKRIKVLKYILLLVEWFKGLKSGSKLGLKVPSLEDMGNLVGAWGSDIVAGVTKRFADGGQLNKWHTDRFITHVLALAIVFDSCTMDTHDIQNDLRLETKDVSKYYAELGCTTAAPTEIERTKLGISKAEGSNHRIARLRLPLVFPKMRAPVGRKKR